MWILIIVLAGITAGIINNYLNHRKDMEQIKLDHVDKQIELERIKQENYLLENEEMRTVLDRIREDNMRLAEQKNSKWLIEETRERQLENREK